MLFLCKRSAETIFIQFMVNCKNIIYLLYYLTTGNKAIHERVISKAPAKLFILYAKFDTKLIFVFSDTKYSVGSTTNRSGYSLLNTQINEIQKSKHLGRSHINT